MRFVMVILFIINVHKYPIVPPSIRMIVIIWICFVKNLSLLRKMPCACCVFFSLTQLTCACSAHSICCHRKCWWICVRVHDLVTVTIDPFMLVDLFRICFESSSPRSDRDAFVVVVFFLSFLLSAANQNITRFKNGHFIGTITTQKKKMINLRNATSALHWIL